MEAIARPGGRRSWVRWAALGFIALFIALLVYGIASKGPDNTITASLNKGVAPQAPSFSLEVLEHGTLPARLRKRIGSAMVDGRVTTAELAGGPTVLNMWASWCTPCEQESPHLRAGWKRFGRLGVAFLGVNIQDLREDARAFTRENGLTYPSVRDARRGVADDYGATGIPETYFLDSRGRVVAHVVGVVSERQLEAGILAARAGQVAGTVSGGASFDVR